LTLLVYRLPLSATVTFPSSSVHLLLLIFFFFNDPATPEIYTLSLHDALPISQEPRETSAPAVRLALSRGACIGQGQFASPSGKRSEEHTSELQSPCNLVCRLLLEKKKNNRMYA